MTDNPILDRARAVLQAAVDDGGCLMTREEAMAINAESWDLRTERTRLKTRLHTSEIEIRQLHDENNKLVAEIVAEEARAVRAEAIVAELAHALRRCVEDVDHPGDARARAHRMLQNFNLLPAAPTTPGSPPDARTTSDKPGPSR